MKGYDEHTIAQLVQYFTPEQLAERLQMMTLDRDRHYKAELDLREEKLNCMCGRQTKITSTSIGSDGRHE